MKKILSIFLVFTITISNFDILGINNLIYKSQDSTISHYVGVLEDIYGDEVYQYLNNENEVNASVVLGLAWYEICAILVGAGVIASTQMVDTEEVSFNDLMYSSADTLKKANDNIWTTTNVQYESVKAVNDYIFNNFTETDFQDGTITIPNEYLIDQDYLNSLMLETAMLRSNTFTYARSVINNPIELGVDYKTVSNGYVFFHWYEIPQLEALGYHKYAYARTTVYNDYYGYAYIRFRLIPNTVSFTYSDIGTVDPESYGYEQVIDVTVSATNIDDDINHTKAWGYLSTLYNLKIEVTPTFPYTEKVFNPSLSVDGLNTFMQSNYIANATGYMIQDLWQYSSVATSITSSISIGTVEYIPPFTDVTEITEVPLQSVPYISSLEDYLSIQEFQEDIAPSSVVVGDNIVSYPQNPSVDVTGEDILSAPSFPNLGIVDSINTLDILGLLKALYNAIPNLIAYLAELMAYFTDLLLGQLEGVTNLFNDFGLFIENQFNNLINLLNLIIATILGVFLDKLNDVKNAIGGLYILFPSEIRNHLVTITNITFAIISLNLLFKMFKVIKGVFLR